jgi:NitT/TauT family transport system substrate-binding protein
MKLKILSLILVFSLVACHRDVQAPTLTQLSILSPKGAPALALFPIILDEIDAVDFVDGVEVLSAEFIKGQYDIIIAPVNLGAQLSSKQDNPYVLYAVVTWGNLYVVSTGQQSSATKMAIFGQQAVPGKVLSVVEPLFKVRYEFDPFASVAEVSAQMLASQYEVGLLAEPSLSATLVRAQASGVVLGIEYDVQALWQEKTGHFNYPQAGLFIRKSLAPSDVQLVSKRFTRMRDYIQVLQDTKDLLDEDVVNLDLDAMGLPSSVILKSAFERMNVKPLLAQDAFEAIEAFLSEFKLNQLEDFYYHQVGQ